MSNRDVMDKEHIILLTQLNRLRDTLNKGLRYIDENLNCKVILHRDNYLQMFSQFEPSSNFSHYVAEVYMKKLTTIDKLKHDVLKFCVRENNEIQTIFLTSLVEVEASYSYVAIQVNMEHIDSSIIKDMISRTIIYFLEKFKRVVEYENTPLFINKCNKDIVSYLKYINNDPDYNQSYRDCLKQTVKMTLKNCMNCYSDFDFIEDLNIISSMPYEKSYSNGSIAILIEDEYNDIDDIINNIKFDIKFNEEILISNHRSIRKMLQISKGEYILVTDMYKVYGICKKQELQKLYDVENIQVRFKGNYAYSFEFNDGTLIDFENGYPINKIDEFNKSKFITKVKATFKDIEEDKINRLYSICDKARVQKKGTMIVISRNAKLESDRLKSQAILIDPVRLDLNLDIINNISSIDGSILIDENGMCYAIGVILDGSANRFGNKGRGARFNSAMKYVYSQGNHSCLAMVISEDGMVSIIS